MQHFLKYSHHLPWLFFRGDISMLRCHSHIGMYYGTALHTWITMWKGVPKKWKGLALSPPQLDPLLISHMHLAYLVFTDSEVIEPVVFQTPVQSLEIMAQMQMYWVIILSFKDYWGIIQSKATDLGSNFFVKHVFWSTELYRGLP